MNRYLSTGRFISPELVAEYGDRPTQNFESIINMEELIDGYSRYSNDVARGEKPILKGESPHLHSGRTGHNGSGDVLQRNTGIEIRERTVGESEELNFSEETDENTKAVRNERTLRKQVERLKTLVKLQGNITHGSVFTDASVGKQATELQAKYNIKQNANSKVKEALHKFYAFISTAKEFDWNDIQREAGKVAAILLENERLNVGDFFIFM